MKKKAFPKPSGEYAVGTLTYTVRDDREETLPAGGMRSVAARVYYPALKESAEGLPKTAALSDDMIKGFKNVFHIAPDFRKDPEANLSECRAGAEWVPGKFPLILFSHGYGSYREGNSFLCIELASHGYVVIAVAHSHEALCTEFDDGSTLPFDKSLPARQYEPKLAGALAMLKVVRARGGNEELAALFDETQRKYCAFMMGRTPEWVKDTEAALEYAKAHFSDRIDFEKGVGASGHSMGGNTAYALCVGNPEIRCGINMDGALFGDYAGAVLTKPFLQISCADNEKVAARAYLRHTEPVWKVLFKDMKHMGFADAKYTMPFKSVVGKLDADVLHENLCRCHLEFFDAYLKGLKEQPELQSNDAVTVSVFPPDLP